MQYIRSLVAKQTATSRSGGLQGVQIDIAYFRKWLIIAVLIGVVAGLGSIAFYAAIAQATKLFLGLGAGYTPPLPAGEGATVVTAITRRWLIPVVTTGGGLLCGIIVYGLAPEAEGHGTDAAIEAFHHKGGLIRRRIPYVKLVASAITIGSGGSAGREGPTAQISAGFGSFLGDVLHLDEHDRRIAMAAGVGAGIGSIFKAPFGGALLSAEIPYKRDFEAEALFPAFIASVVGYSIYGSWAGWTPIFGHGARFDFTHPSQLLGFILLGIACGLVGHLYPRCLYGVRDLFKRVPVPHFAKPAIGGLIVGSIGMFLPQALGMGYGWVQFGINGDFSQVSAGLMLGLVFVKIVTTSFTIGTGGSGGVFGPGIVIGGFLGAGLWGLMHGHMPFIPASAGAFAVVGMMAFFGGIAKAPLAVILMVAEMTGEYSLIVPSMLATMIAYLITGEVSIYESQVPTRLDSPAHKDDYALPLLQSITVERLMRPSHAFVSPDAQIDDVARLLREHHVVTIPVLDHGQLVGIVTARDVARLDPEQRSLTRVRQVMTRQMALTYPDASLYEAWTTMTRLGYKQLPVVEREHPDHMLGVVTAMDIGEVLQLPVQRAAATAAEHQQQDRESPAPEHPFAHLHVAQAMTRDFIAVPEDLPVAEVRNYLQGETSAVIVLDRDNKLAGIITALDLRGRANNEKGHALTAGDVATKRVVTVQPHDTLHDAARLMTELSLRQMPVVAAEDNRRVIGLLRRRDLVAAYGLTQIASGRQVTAPQVHTVQASVRQPGAQEAAFFEFTIPADAAIAGKSLHECNPPKECVLVSVYRNGQLLLPHGDTVLQPGDQVLAFCPLRYRQRILAYFTRPKVSADQPSPFSKVEDRRDQHT
jgi:CIC family chloride channel protein